MHSSLLPQMDRWQRRNAKQGVSLRTHSLSVGCISHSQLSQTNCSTQTSIWKFHNTSGNDQHALHTAFKKEQEAHQWMCIPAELHKLYSQNSLHQTICWIYLLIMISWMSSLVQPEEKLNVFFNDKLTRPQLSLKWWEIGQNFVRQIMDFRMAQMLSSISPVT